MIERSRRARLFSGSLTSALFCAAAYSFMGNAAYAKRDGISASSCSGCHGSTLTADIQASALPAQFAPGDEVTITLSVRFAGSAVGGVFIAEPELGQVRALNQELKAVSGGLAHSAPKPAVDGQTSFQFTWRAPSTPGAVHFEVAALSGNGDGRSSGDATATDLVSLVYGCSPETFFRDLDGDGYGSERASPIIDCAGMPPAGFSTRKDDCDDTYERIFPGAPEICNTRDDDCDTEVDEGAPPVELWPDEDGDGYYSLRTGTPIIGCAPLSGYAADPGDCAPRDPMRHPGATEICNLLDDNCDNREDERLRPQCGVGLCLRNSPSCDAEDCRPGFPTLEVCNLLDDDCNGVVDDGASCTVGKSCVDGACVTSGGAPSTNGGSGGTGGGPGGGSSNGEVGGSNDGRAGGSALAGRAGSGAPGWSDGGSSSRPEPNAGASARAPAPADAGGCALAPSQGSAMTWSCLALVAVVLRRRSAKGRS